MKSVLIWLLFAQIGIIEPDIRTDFHSQKITETYLVTLQMDNQWNLKPLVEGYVGVAETMLAEEVFWPIEKLNYFNRGKKKLSTQFIKIKMIQNYDISVCSFSLTHQDF